MSELCRVLEEDAEPAEAIPAPRREQAIAECLASLVVFPAGNWDTRQAVPGREGIGLLVLAYVAAQSQADTPPDARGETYPS